MNTNLRKENNDFEKDFFNSTNNANFVKPTENRDQKS